MKKLKLLSVLSKVSDFRGIIARAWIETDNAGCIRA